MQQQDTKTIDVAFDQERFLDFLLHYATIQTSCGIQTSRIVLNTARIAEAYGYDATMMLFQRNVAITIIPHCYESKPSLEYRRNAHATTALTHHRSLPLNFHFNAELSRFSWWVFDNKPTIEELEERFESLINLPRLNRWLTLSLVSCANSALCLLFGGDAWATVFVFVATLIGFYARQELHLRHAYHYFMVLSAAFLSSLTAGLLNQTGLTTTPQVVLSTSVLYLIPGVPIINGIMDFFDGYILNGISRLVNALLFVVSISIGISLTLFFLELSVL